jgi:hypothetical protein
MPPASKPVEAALNTFSAFMDYEKLLESIQSIVLENIFRNSRENLHNNVEDLV